jgi:chromatin modification-related protein EAF6
LRINLSTPFFHATTHYTMTENAPPASANAASDAASRGMPYYERLRRDLRESLKKKHVLDQNLVRTKKGAF